MELVTQTQLQPNFKIRNKHTAETPKYKDL